MELGNMVFGNSRGSFSLPRGKGWEEELSRLFDAYAPDRDSSWREYGIEFENDTFFVSTYYWGDCTCGFEEKFNKAYDKWGLRNKHSKKCFHSKYEVVDLQLRDKHGSCTEEYDKDLWKWAKENGFKGKMGVAVYCDCGYDNKYQKFVAKQGDHLPDCLLLKPNFLYKPTGFEIQWYKYPLRDSYANKRIRLKTFKKIIDSCINSLTKKT